MPTPNRAPVSSLENAIETHLASSTPLPPAHVVPAILAILDHGARLLPRRNQAEHSDLFLEALVELSETLSQIIVDTLVIRGQLEPAAESDTGSAALATTPTHETDPQGLAPGDAGAKLDAGKIKGGVLGDFSLALLAVAEVGTHGADKYSRGGWQQVPQGQERYGDAAWRHLLKRRHSELDPDSNLPHLAHQAWNVLAELELSQRKECTQLHFGYKVPEPYADIKQAD